MELRRPLGIWESLVRVVDPAQIEEIKRVIGFSIIQENIVNFSYTKQ